MTIKLSLMIRKMEEKGVPNNALKIIWEDVFVKLYIDYDIKKDFLSQFHNNIDLLFKSFSNIQNQLEI